MELTKSQQRRIKTLESWIGRVEQMMQRRQAELRSLEEKRSELERLKQEVLTSRQ